MYCCQFLQVVLYLSMLVAEASKVDHLEIHGDLWFYVLSKNHLKFVSKACFWSRFGIIPFHFASFKMKTCYHLAFCGGVYDAKFNGTIFSPGYPQGYHADTQCTWLIKVSAHKSLKLDKVYTDSRLSKASIIQEKI